MVKNSDGSDWYWGHSDLTLLPLKSMGFSKLWCVAMASLEPDDSNFVFVCIWSLSKGMHNYRSLQPSNFDLWAKVHFYNVNPMGIKSRDNSKAITAIKVIFIPSKDPLKTISQVKYQWPWLYFQGHIEHSKFEPTWCVTIGSRQLILNIFMFPWCPSIQKLNVGTMISHFDLWPQTLLPRFPFPMLEATVGMSWKKEQSSMHSHVKWRVHIDIVGWWIIDLDLWFKVMAVYPRKFEGPANFLKEVKCSRPIWLPRITVWGTPFFWCLIQISLPCF